MTDFVNRTSLKNGTDMFVSVYKFSSTDSKVIDDSLFLKKDFHNCYLSGTGSLAVYKKSVTSEQSTGEPIVEYVNTFTKSKVIVSSGIQPIVLDPTVSNQKYFFSPNSKWILYKKIENSVPIYSILYNTFHHIEFKNYYSQPDNKNTSMALINKYCKEVQNVDDACKCFNFDDNPACLYNLIGKNDTDFLKSKTDTGSRTTYGKLASNCACMNQRCVLFKSRADSTTFIPEYIKTDKNNCIGDYTTVFCNSVIEAGGNISTSNKLNLNQTCSASGINLPNGSPPTTPPTTPPGTSQDNIFGINKNYVYIGGGVLLLLLIGGGILLKKKKGLESKE